MPDAPASLLDSRSLPSDRLMEMPCLPGVTVKPVKCATEREVRVLTRRVRGVAQYGVHKVFVRFKPVVAAEACVDRSNDCCCVYLSFRQAI